MNLNEAMLNDIDQRVRAFIPAAKDLLIERTNSAAALAQERLNAVWELIFSLPVYRDLKMDEECNYHTFERLMADREKWAQVQDPTSEGYAKYQGMITGLTCFADGLRKFRQQISLMTEKYFEPLERRNSNAYAEAYTHFYADMISLDAWLFSEDFVQSFPTTGFFGWVQNGVKVRVLNMGTIEDTEIGRLKKEQVFINFLRMLCEIAGENGQEILIEPLGPKYSNYMNTVPEAARVIEAANMPNLAVMADIRHFVWSKEPFEDIVKYRDLVRHIHVDYPLSYPERKYPSVGDDYDYAPFFQQLKDYDGTLTIEADIPSDWNRAGADARELLTTYGKK